MEVSSLRSAALDIFRAGLRAANPYRLMRQHAHLEGSTWHYESPGASVTWELPAQGCPGRVLVVGAGKAAASLARALEESLGHGVSGGRIVVKHGHGFPLKHIVVEEGGHPLPNLDGQTGTRRLLDDLADTGPEDRILFLLTGGASALLVAPAEPVTLEDKIQTTRQLLSCGATIQEMNAVRKHLSTVKGGRLLEQMAPARVLTLIVSDVVGDDLSAIGSGPTAPDPSTFADALAVLRRYGLTDRVPGHVLWRLTEGAAGRAPETPKPGEPLFDSAEHVILASNRLSLEAAERQAASMGFRPEVFACDMVGSTHERARAFAARLLEGSGKGRLALLAGGETTLTVAGSGKGGRNQEFALVTACEMHARKGLLVLSAGTDGTD
ncbi:MAG: glycerate kinase, partial [Acidobacteriota bacterium]